MSSYTLLTGATGLVGRYLIRDLLMSGERLAVVIRQTERESVTERIESILQMWESQEDCELSRPVCLVGEVTQPGLGLDAASRHWIARHCHRMIHNAAVLTFHGADRADEPWRTNLDGTRNTLRLCRETGLRDLHYVSTAYVCGCRDGVVREDELDQGQSFRNDYEHSKFLSEKLVRDADFLDRLTVYRPGVIAGDSQTGYTNTYHGLYLYLKLMSVLVRNETPGLDGVRTTNIRLYMTGDEPRNIVPVDWVSRVMCRLLSTPAAHGQTFHLSPIEPITPRQIIEAGYKYFNSRGVEFCGRKNADRSQMTDFERAAYDSMTMYESYEHTDPRFDTTNVQKFAADLPCPRIDEAMLHRFWRYGEEDRWGRRKQPRPAEGCRARDHLDSLVARSGPASLRRWSGQRSVIGLDVCGPGGGQWQLILDGFRPVAVEPGLPARPTGLVRLSIAEFERLAAGEMPPVPPSVGGLVGGSALNGHFNQAVLQAIFPDLRSSGSPFSMESGAERVALGNGRQHAGR